MSAPNKLSFSLGKPKSNAPPVQNAFAAPVKPIPINKGKAVAGKPPAASLFGGDDDEDEDAVRRPSKVPSIAKVSDSNDKPATGMVKPNATMSRAQKKLQEEALKLDQTVFEYDEVWDGMQNAREKVKEAKESEAGKRDVSGHVGYDLEPSEGLTYRYNLRSPSTSEHFSNLRKPVGWIV
jgi:hypothetical protein